MPLRCLLLALWLPLAGIAAGQPPSMVLIIDDLGDQAAAGSRVARLPGPVVCSILPQTPHGRALAHSCHARNKEVMLHLPMEAVNGADPGPGAVTLDMLPEEFRHVVRQGLAEIPHVGAVNNHMGSLLTQAPAPMGWLMEELVRDARDLAFVDSRTSTRTVAYRIAREHGVPAVSRDVFLDHDREPDSIRRQFMRLLDMARREGVAVGIGHPYPETLAVLEDELPDLEAAHGVRLVSLRELLRRD